MGLAIVLIALAVVAVPSNYVWGDPPGDPEDGGAIKVYPCENTSCRVPEGMCNNTCAGEPCNLNGADPKKAMCQSAGATCVCYMP